jgi:hypothetical protein
MNRALTVFFLLGTLAILPRVQAQQTYLAGQAGIAMPMSTFGDSYKTGFGGQATFLYNLIEEGIWINAQVGYLRFGGEIRTLVGDQTGKNVTAKHWATIPVLGSIRYQLNKGNMRAYIGASAGYNFVSREIEYTNLGNVSLDAGTESAMGAGLLVGFLYPITPSLHFDATLSYNTVLTERLEDTPGYFSIMVGVMLPVNL